MFPLESQNMLSQLEEKSMYKTTCLSTSRSYYL